MELQTEGTFFPLTLNATQLSSKLHCHGDGKNAQPEQVHGLVCVTTERKVIKQCYCQPGLKIAASLIVMCESTAVPSGEVYRQLFDAQVGLRSHFT